MMVEEAKYLDVSMQKLICMCVNVWQIAQSCKGAVKKIHMWDSVKSLARGYESMMGLLLFAPVAILAWFPFISDFQTRLLFNQAFSRGLQISRILGGRKDKKVD
jgi:callose synthase